MKPTLIVLAATFLISSCTAWSASDVKQPDFASIGHAPDVQTASNLITFKVAGTLVKTSGWNISEFVRDGAGALGLNITTNMHQDKRTILMNLNGVTPGAYH